MSPDTIIDISQQALKLTSVIAAPILLTALFIGLLVGMLQAATQINENTLSFIPKLFAIVVAFFVTGPWMLQTLLAYTRGLIESIPGLLQ